MTATPAWPPRSLPRLYVDPPLSAGVAVGLDAAQANYLGNVLCLNEGGLLFDGVSGEWLALNRECCIRPNADTGRALIPSRKSRRFREGSHASLARCRLWRRLVRCEGQRGIHRSCVGRSRRGARAFHLYQQRDVGRRADVQRVVER